MHWLTLVLSPRETIRVEEAVAQLLSPPPDREFPGEALRCPCVGAVAEMQTHASLDASPEGRELLRRLRRARRDGDSAGEAEVLEERWGAVAAQARRHPLWAKPDPECDICAGTGTYERSRSPGAQWDYWQIGGHWDGVLTHARGPGDHGSRGGNLERNCVPVPELPEDLVPDALVTPDGMWHEYLLGGSGGREPERADREFRRGKARVGAALLVLLAFATSPSRARYAWLFPVRGRWVQYLLGGLMVLLVLVYIWLLAVRF